MRALACLACGLALSLAACTEQIELFPALAPADAAADAAPADGGLGCVPARDPAGAPIPCVCKLPCGTDADCPSMPDASGVRCDAATGLCASHGASCQRRTDCPAAGDPSTGGPRGGLCISAK
jgi:hypothetical protein